MHTPRRSERMSASRKWPPSSSSYIPPAIWSAFLLLLDATTASAGSIPFAYFHAHGSSCAFEKGLWQYFISATGSQGQCIAIDASKSKSLTMWKQAEFGCRNLSSNPLFANGLNLVGTSLGGIVARTILQTCDTLPPVNNLISIGSPQAGVASLPLCGPQVLFPFPCAWKSFLAERVYRNTSLADLVKVPAALDVYYKNNKFLPYINNELASTRNETYKERVKKLNTLVLIKFRSDHQIYPRDSEHFRFFANGSYSDIPPLEDTVFYKEDHLGIRYLMERGSVKIFTVPGGHGMLSNRAADKSVVPYL